jgi:G3E family GTPase
VTILSGLKGAGKTSLLKHVFSNETGLRVAVIVDEIDYEGFATMFPEKDLEIEEEFVRFKNGCLCVAAGDSLAEELLKLASGGQFDHIIIESSGVAEPM